MTSAEIKNKHTQVSGRYMCQWIYAVSAFSMLLQMCVCACEGGKTVKEA